MIAFTYRGRKSTEFGIMVMKQPELIAPQSRLSIEEISGTNQIYVEEHGLASYIMDIDLLIQGQENITPIEDWLVGRGKFERSDYPGKYLNIEFQSGREYRRYQEDMYTVTMSMYVYDPIWRDFEDFKVVSGGYTNTGLALSYPLIRLEGTAETSVDITFPHARLVYNFPAGETWVEIDCQNKLAMGPNSRKRQNNLHIGYDYPQFKPGYNPIYINSGNVVIKIKEGNRWL